MTPAIDLQEIARCHQSEYRAAWRLFQWNMITGKLEAFGGNRSKAAKALGIHRNTLLRIVGELRSINLVVPMGRTAKHGRRTH